MTCLMRSSVGDIMSTTDGKPLMLRLLAECEAAAQHAGYPLRASVIEYNKKILTDKNSIMTSSMLRDLESGGRTEGGHIVNDMRQRVLASGSDATLLTLAWTHLQAREARLSREKKKRRKKVSDLDLAINLRPLINELDRLLLHPLLQCLILSYTLTGSIVTDILGDLH